MAITADNTLSFAPDEVKWQQKLTHLYVFSTSITKHGLLALPFHHEDGTPPALSSSVLLSSVLTPFLQRFFYLTNQLTAEITKARFVIQPRQRAAQFHRFDAQTCGQQSCANTLSGTG